MFLHVSVILSTGRGSPAGRTPQQGDPPGGENPPIGRPPGRENPQAGRNPPPAGRPPNKENWQGEPPRQGDPLGREIPPRYGEPSQQGDPQRRTPPPRHTVNERPVGILLECILVSENFFTFVLFPVFFTFMCLIPKLAMPSFSLHYGHLKSK